MLRNYVNLINIPNRFSSKAYVVYQVNSKEISVMWNLNDNTLLSPKSIILRDENTQKQNKAIQ